MSTKAEEYTLGSGLLYVAVYNALSGIPEDAVLEVEDNILGYIQGGATLKYEPETYEVADDLGYVKETLLTKETVTLTSGLLTWNGNTLKTLVGTARVEEDSSNSIRKTKIGGLSNYVNEKYVIRFVHANNGKKVTIVGNNAAGFEFAFNPTKETVVNVEFNASSLDADGTLVIFEEPIL